MEGPPPQGSGPFLLPIVQVQSALAGDWDPSADCSSLSLSSAFSGPCFSSEISGATALVLQTASPATAVAAMRDCSFASGVSLNGGAIASGDIQRRGSKLPFVGVSAGAGSGGCAIAAAEEAARSKGTAARMDHWMRACTFRGGEPCASASIDFRGRQSLVGFRVPANSPRCVPCGSDPLRVRSRALCAVGGYARRRCAVRCRFRYPIRHREAGCG